MLNSCSIYQQWFVSIILLTALTSESHPHVCCLHFLSLQKFQRKNYHTAASNFSVLWLFDTRPPANTSKSNNKLFFITVKDLLWNIPANFSCIINSLQYSSNFLMPEYSWGDGKGEVSHKRFFWILSKSLKFWIPCLSAQSGCLYCTSAQGTAYNRVNYFRFNFWCICRDITKNAGRSPIYLSRDRDQKLYLPPKSRTVIQAAILHQTRTHTHTNPQV